MSLKYQEVLKNWKSIQQSKQWQGYFYFNSVQWSSKRIECPRMFGGSIILINLDLRDDELVKTNVTCQSWCFWKGHLTTWI